MDHLVYAFTSPTHCHGQYAVADTVVRLDGSEPSSRRAWANLALKAGRRQALRDGSGAGRGPNMSPGDCLSADHASAG